MNWWRKLFGEEEKPKAQAKAATSNPRIASAADSAVQKDATTSARRVNQLISDLSTDDHCSDAILELLKIQDEAIPQVLASLNNPNIKIRRWVSYVLGKVDPAAVIRTGADKFIKAMEAATKDADMVVSISSRCALAKVTGRDVELHLRAICEGLNSSEPSIRGAAALSLDFLGHKALPAAERLFYMLKKEKDPIVHMHASRALESIGWNPALGGMPDDVKFI